MALTVAQTADAGAPQAGITVDGLSVVTPCTVTVSVSSDGGTTWSDVRGGTMTGVLGSTFLRDYVVPLNVAATYRAVVTGGTSATWTTTLTITSPYAWLQDPLAPKSAVQVATVDQSVSSALLLVAPSFSSLTRKQPSEVVSVLGGALPVAAVGVRQAPSGVPLSIQGLAATQGSLLASLRSLLASSGQIVIRGLPAYAGFDAVAHVVAGDVSDSPVVSGSMLGVFQTFTLSISQVRPVTTRVVVPWWTNDQVTALVQSQLSGGTTTYAQVLAAQPVGKTYTQWLANPGVAS